MKLHLVAISLICSISGLFAAIPTSPVFANTPAREACNDYSSNAANRNACIQGFNSQSCSTQNGALLSACEKGASGAKQLNANTSKGCDVPGLGWIVCWISRFIGWMTDGLFRVMETMLTTPSLDQNKDGGRETYKVWASFRNIANVILIIVFTTVIISQVTNAGINNYGIKKLLPRIIVGAILVNLSFIICGLVIDATNIAGSSIKDILVSVAIPVKPEFNAWSSIISIMLVGAGAVAIFLNIFAMAPVLLSGLIALLMTVLILVIRQALLIALIIIAPIAFALNILPSTQKWFSKWWSTFVILACVFPIISFVFGATRVAAGVISASAPTGTVTTIIFGVFALGVQSIPFFVTPLILKAGGGLLNRFTGVINNPSKGLVDKGRRQVDRWAQNKTAIRETNALTGDGKGLYARAMRRRNIKAQTSSHHADQLKNHSSGAYGRFIGSAEESARLANKAAGSAGANVFDSTGSATERAARLKDSLGNISMELEVSDIDAAEAVIIANGSTSKDLNDMINSGKHKDGSAVTEDEKNAAIRNLASQGNIDDIHNLIGKMSDMKAGTMTLKALADGIDKSGVSKNAAHLGPQGTQMIRSGGAGSYASTNSLYSEAAKAGAYNSETLASESSKSLKGLTQNNVLGSLSPEIRSGLQKSRDLIQTRDKLKGRVSASSQSYLNKL